MPEVVSHVIAAFQDEAFRAKVEEFSAMYVDVFAQVCPDGSHPLEWMRMHQKYKNLHENFLMQQLDSHGASIVDFMSYMEQCELHYGSDPGFRQLTEALTASEEYLVFLEVMFTSVRENWVPDDDAPPPEPNVQVHEVDVTVPDGLAEGMAMSVSYLGTMHEVVVPPG